MKHHCIVRHHARFVWGQRQSLTGGLIMAFIVFGVIYSHINLKITRLSNGVWWWQTIDT